MRVINLCAVITLAALTIASPAQQPAASTSPAKAAPAPSATTVPADQQPSRADVIRMMDAMHIHAQLESMTKTMHQQMKQQVHQMLSSQPALTPEQKKAFDDSYEATANVYPITEMMDDMIPVYQRHMNKADIDAIVTFYSSPAGQHLLSEFPALNKDSMSVLIPKLQTRMQAYMEKTKKEINAAAPKAEPKGEPKTSTDPSAGPIADPASKPASPAATPAPKP